MLGLKDPARSQDQALVRSRPQVKQDLADALAEQAQIQERVDRGELTTLALQATERTIQRCRKTLAAIDNDVRQRLKDGAPTELHTELQSLNHQLRTNARRRSEVARAIEEARGRVNGDRRQLEESGPTWAPSDRERVEGRLEQAEAFVQQLETDLAELEEERATLEATRAEHHDKMVFA